MFRKFSGFFGDPGKKDEIKRINGVWFPGLEL